MRIREATVADAAAIGRISVDTWRSTYRGIVPDAHLDALDAGVRTASWERTLIDGQSFVYVAEAPSGEVVGYICGGAERGGDPQFTGELYAIYVLASAQGSGAGRRLTRTLAARLQQAGHNSMLVWVLADNPFRRFYEALGAQYLRSQSFELGGAQLEEAAYGWPDLRALLSG